MCSPERTGDPIRDCPKARSATGVLDPDELPIPGFDDLNEAIGAIKDLTSSRDVRTIVAYEEAYKNRQRVVSAAQTASALSLKMSSESTEQGVGHSR